MGSDEIFLNLLFIFGLNLRDVFRVVNRYRIEGVNLFIIVLF